MFHFVNQSVLNIVSTSDFTLHMREGLFDLQETSFKLLIFAFLYFHMLLDIHCHNTLHMLSKNVCVRVLYMSVEYICIS